MWVSSCTQECWFLVLLGVMYQLTIATKITSLWTTPKTSKISQWAFIMLTGNYIGVLLTGLAWLSGSASHWRSVICVEQLCSLCLSSFLDQWGSRGMFFSCWWQRPKGGLGNKPNRQSLELDGTFWLLPTYHWTKQVRWQVQRQQAAIYHLLTRRSWQKCRSREGYKKVRTNNQTTGYLCVWISFLCAVSFLT